MTYQGVDSTKDDAHVSSDKRLSLADLTEAADVSARTVRYYIAEGLLSPPVAAGAKSFYARGHLDRLRLIARYKASYLPLKEIRRRLAALDDAAVRAHLAEQPRAVREPGGEELDSAASYVTRLLKPSPRPPSAFPSSAMASSPRPPSGPVDPYQASMTPFAAAERPSYDMVAPRMAEVQPSAESTCDDQGAWRRVSLGDDAELLIREEAYRRKRDRVEWLVTWARKVFG